MQVKYQKCQYLIYFSSRDNLQEVKKAAKQLAVTQLPLKNVFLWSKYMHS